MRRSKRAPDRITSRGWLVATCLWIAGSARALPTLSAPAADATLDEIRVALDDGDYACAESEARVALTSLVQSAGASRAALADTTLVLAESLRFSDRVLGDEALATALLAVELATAIPGLDLERIAASLTNLGHLRYMRDEYADARATLESSLDVDWTRSDPPPARAGLTLSLLASLTSIEGGDRTRGRELFERAREVQDATLDATHPDVGFRHLLQGNVAHEASEYASAQGEYERAIEIWSQCLRPRHPLIARALSNLGNSLQPLGDYVGARKCLREALAMRIEAYGEWHRHVASTYNNLGRLEFLVNNPSGAREHWERALDIETNAGGARSMKCAFYHRGIGECFRAELRIADAAKEYERALAIVEERTGSESPACTDLLLLLAGVHLGAGDLETTEQWLDRAERSMASTDDSDMYARAEIVALQSRLDIERGEPAHARERLERTLDLVAAKLGADLPIYAGLLAVAAQADEATGDTDPALEKALRAEEIQRAHQLETGRMLDEHGALAQGGYRTAYLNRALQLALGTSRPQLRERAWDALAHSRGLVFEEIAQRSRMARESSDPRVARVAGKLAAARDELARLTVRGPGGLSPEEFRARLANARAKKKAAEEELADLDGRLRDRSRESDARLAQRLEALPASSALVSYVRCEPDGDDAFYLAFVSPATRAAPIVAKLGAAREIDALVSRTCMAARNSLDLDEYRSVAAELRKRVFDPLAEALRGAREILVIPDGALALVNFAALPVGDSAYLVESGVLFRTLCAERDLAPLDDATVDETPSGRGLLALGGPSFDGRVPLLAKADVSSTSSLGRPRSASVELPASYAALSFHPLPGAAAEIARVKSLWLASLPTATDRHDDSDGVLSFTGDAATEANFKEHAPGRRVLHIATHGFFVRSERAARASNARGVSSSRPPLVVSTALPLEPSEDPLLLSGLAFAGANHRGDATDDADDGILTAEEIAHLDLSSVDCAVLSACETGLGEIASGEGIFGLRRAFQLAGVRSLVVSLWPVDDDTTSAWMTEFYGAGIADGGDTAVAVRAASLATLEARRSRGESEHPYYWCAFMAIGPTRAPRAESTVADTGMDTTTGRR